MSPVAWALLAGAFPAAWAAVLWSERMEARIGLGRAMLIAAAAMVLYGVALGLSA